MFQTTNQNQITFLSNREIMINGISGYPIDIWRQSNLWSFPYTYPCTTINSAILWFPFVWPFCPVATAIQATSSSGSDPACRMSSSKHWEYNSWRKGMEWYKGTFQKRRDKIRLRFIGHEIHLTGKHTWDFNHAQMVGLWHCVSTLLVLHAISRYWLANSNDHVGIQKKWSTTSICLRTSLLWESLFISYIYVL